MGKGSSKELGPKRVWRKYEARQRRIYRKEIRAWDWAGILEEANANVHEEDDIRIGRSYLGTVMNLIPSGKYYTPWACSNVRMQEANLDEVFYEELEGIASEYDMFIESGDGDPCDLFAAIVVDNEENEEAEEEKKEPGEEDVVCGGHDGPFYYGGKRIATTAEELHDWMKNERYWPDVWLVNDHGNAHVITIEGGEK